MPWQAIDGIILLDKPTGLSSNQALQKVRRYFLAKKAGHTGTLDPLATGMLPIAFGQATKFIQFLLDADKSYTATVQLGQATTTGDSEGEPLAQQAVPELTASQLQTVLHEFVGQVTQTPPIYSALKYQGKPMCYWARKGIVVPQKQRVVTIHSLTLLDWQPDLAQLAFQVCCSKGTYVRTLSEDLAKKLGTLGHLIVLRRDHCAGFAATAMHTLDAVAAAQDSAALSTLLLPVDTGLQHWPLLDITPEQCAHLQQGRKQQADIVASKTGWYRVVCADRFMGMLHYDQGICATKLLVG